jgi:6-phospho-3-hexuloisomerase
MTGFDALVSTVLGELEASLRATDASEANALRQAIVEAPRIFVAGRGRSGLQMRAFAMRLMHLGLTVYVVDDVTTPAIEATDLLLLGSGSGRTTSLVGFADRAKSLGTRIVLITSVEVSPIAERADLIVHIKAPSPKANEAGAKPSAQPMANLFEQALGLLLDIITMQLMDTLKLTSEQMFRRHANLE